MAGALNAGESTLQKSPIRPQSKDAGKGNPNGQAFVADAYAPKDVALDELEEVGAMAVDKAAEEEGKSQEEGIAGNKAAEEQGDNPKGQVSVTAVPERARIAKTKKSPVGMTAAEWQTHRLTHLPYNPACRCCVAGRKRDDQHRRRTTDSVDMNIEGKESICAD